MFKASGIAHARTLKRVGPPNVGAIDHELLLFVEELDLFFNCEVWPLVHLVAGR